MAKSDFLNSVRQRLRRLDYSLRTEESYVRWIKQYILINNKQHPSTLGKVEMEAFLTYLAVHRKVSPATQNQALSALLFMYKQVLEIDSPWVENVVRATPKKNIPVVLSKEEVVRLLDKLKKQYRLIGKLLYGTGMRLMELARLRVKDLDFAYKAITIRDSKGNKDRVVMLPESLIDGLHDVLEERCRVFEADLVNGTHDVYMPYALDKKYPNAGREWIWQYVFAAPKLSTDPRTGAIRRHHIFEQSKLDPIVKTNFGLQLR